MKVTLVALLGLWPAVLFGAVENLVPSPRLRPSDPARFYGSSVKMAGDHLRELQTVVASNLHRADIAEQLVDHKALRKAAADAPFLAALLPHASGNVQEWVLKSLGEARGEKTAAIPHLLRLAGDDSRPEMVRSLAVRVLGTTPIDAGSLENLMQLLSSASRDLRLILLEAICGAGALAGSSLERIEAGLRHPDGAIQFYSFRALERIEAATPLTFLASVDYQRAQAVKAEWNVPRLTPRVKSALIASLRDGSSPLLDVAHALLAAGEHRLLEADSLEAILHRTMDSDPFIAELAGNVFDSLDSIPRSSIAVLAQFLSHPDAGLRTRAATMLARVGPDTSVLPAVLRALGRPCPPKELAAYCDVLRSLGTNAAPASEALLAFLPEENSIYKGLRKHEAYELRAYLLVTLAETAVPPGAMPFILDGLANTEDEMPQLFSAAARAAGALGSAAKEAVPFLGRALEGSVRDTFISFASFGEHSATRDYTTCQIEALRALGRIGKPASSTVPLVTAFLQRELPDFDHSARIQRAPNLRAEARAALAAIQEAP